MGQRRRRSGRRAWRQWREDEARAVLAEFAASGESMAAFARRRGLSVKRLSYWRRRLARVPPVRFAPVTVVAAAAASGASVEVVVRGVVVRTRVGVEPAQVAGLVAALAVALPPC